MLGNAASLRNTLLTVVLSLVKKIQNKPWIARAVVSILIQPHCNLAMCLI